MTFKNFKTSISDAKENLIDKLYESFLNKKSWIGVIASSLVIFSIYPILAVMSENISSLKTFPIEEAGTASPTDKTLSVTTMPHSGSLAVATSIYLIDQEIHQNSWTPNNPWFFPTAILDNMPNYQQGIMAANSRFITELADDIGRIRGSSQIDPDLEKASGRIRYPGNIWIWQPSVSIWPQSTSEEQYNDAQKALLSYNKRLSLGNAIYDKRADNLIATLERISSDLGSAAATIENSLENPKGLFDTKADDVFYQNKGRLYAYYHILKALGADFNNVLEEKNAKPLWEKMITSLENSLELSPTIVSNTEQDDFLFNTHLTSQGYHLLTVRTQLKETIAVLMR